jgi:hypothetical protein
VKDLLASAIVRKEQIEAASNSAILKARARTQSSAHPKFRRQREPIQYLGALVGPAGLEPAT